MLPKKITLKDGLELIIREAEEKDAANIIAYVQQILKETVFLSRAEGEFNKTVKEEEGIILEHHAVDNKIFLIGEIEEKVVSVVSAGGNQKKKEKHHIDFGISVLQKYWGAGVGSAMMQAMINWAKSTEVIRKINLTVQENNEAAIALYKKFGFVEEGKISREALIDGKFYASYWMGLEID